jgi:hypothetical protein
MECSGKLTIGSELVGAGVFKTSPSVPSARYNFPPHYYYPLNLSQDIIALPSLLYFNIVPRLLLLFHCHGIISFSPPLLLVLSVIIRKLSLPPYHQIIPPPLIVINGYHHHHRHYHETTTSIRIELHPLIKTAFRRIRDEG